MELKHFSLEGANATLPLVKSIITDIDQSWKKLQSIDSELNTLLCETLNDSEISIDIAEELRAKAGSYYDKFQSSLKEMNELGVILLDMENFSVGFTTVINEKVQVYVFRPEEDSEIKFYRNIEADGELTPIEELNEKV